MGIVNIRKQNMIRHSAACDRTLELLNAPFPLH